MMREKNADFSLCCGRRGQYSKDAAAAEAGAAASAANANAMAATPGALAKIAENSKRIIKY